MIFLSLLQESSSAADEFSLAWIDWIAVGLLFSFLGLGILRGLWWQVVRLAGLAASGALAWTFAGGWGAKLENSLEISNQVAVGAVWLGLFLAGIVITALLGTLGKKSLAAMQLGLMDRAGGALAGLITGLFLHAGLLVGLSYLAPKAWAARILEDTYSVSLLDFAMRHEALVRGHSPSTESLKDWLPVMSKDSGLVR
jgi:uncharacterized membrane protein required for colicin V production